MKIKDIITNLINWIGKLMTDSSGNPSSKRIATFAIVFLLVKKVLNDPYTDNDMELIEQLLWATGAILGILTVEGFGKKINAGNPDK